MNILFQFKAHGHVDGRSEPLMIKASRRWVEQYIRAEEFLTLFGGYIEWRKPAEPTLEMPDEAIGVWGVRMVSRFKRILRERGAVYDIVLEEGPIQELKMEVKQSGRKLRRGRPRKP